MSDISPETLTVGKSSDNSAIRFGRTGVSINALQQAIKLFASRQPITSSDIAEQEGDIRTYYDRLVYLAKVTHLIVENEPESVISTFLAQAAHYLAADNPVPKRDRGLSSSSESVLFPSVTTLEIKSNAIPIDPSRFSRPFFHTLAISLPALSTLNVHLPRSLKDEEHFPQGPIHSAVHGHIDRGKKLSWSRLETLSISGVFDGTTIPCLRGVTVHVKFEPSRRPHPESGERYHMATPQVVLKGDTRRLARAGSIREAVLATIHIAQKLAPSYSSDSSGPMDVQAQSSVCSLGGTASGINSDPTSESRAEISWTGTHHGSSREGLSAVALGLAEEPGELNKRVHGKLILEDYDIGLDEQGIGAADADWVENKVRRWIEGYCAKEGKEAVDLVQARVIFRPTVFGHVIA